MPPAADSNTIRCHAPPPPFGHKPWSVTLSGVPGRPWYRHAIFAPGLYAGYAAAEYPSLQDVIDRNESTQAFERQVAYVAFTIRSAAEVLDTP